MNKYGCKWIGLALYSIATLLGIGGCGGGGGSSNTGTTPPSVAKAAISGTVSFPSIGSLIAKRVGSLVADTSVTIEVYDLSGSKLASVNPSYDGSITDPAQRIYSYSIPNLSINTDYVIKANKGTQVLRKLLEKKTVVAGTVPGQTIDAVSTVAVLVASQKLSTASNKIILGEAPPAGTDLIGLSQKISIDVKPALLEGEIIAAVGGGKDALTTTTVSYANLFNVVVTSADQQIDPNAIVAGTKNLTVPVPVLTVSGTTVSSTPTAITSTNVTTFVTGCATAYVAPAATESASTYTRLAKQYLTAQDISNAALNYEKALTLDPNDPEANFGGAITSGLLMTDDPDVQAIITKWGAVVPTVNQIVQGTSPIKLPFGNMTSIKITPKTTAKSAASAADSTSATTTQNVLTAFSALKAKLPQQKTGFKSLAKELGLVSTTAPSISEMQTLITNVIIPRIDKITARLAKAEAANFSFTITKAMQGNPLYGTDVVLDAGELYVLDAALNIFQVLFKIASSYNFDIPTQYTYDTIGQDPLAMINSASFFTLKPTGSALMASALTNAQTAAAKAKLAYEKVVVRAAGAGMFDLATWTQLQKDDFTNDLAKVTAALAGPYDVKDNLGALIVKIDATKFFTTPLTKANLPTFGYDVPRDATLSAKYGSAVAGERTYTIQVWNGSAYVSQTRTNAIYSDIVPTSDLPDYSLNGILPGNSAANNVAGFNGILPVIGGKLLTGSVDDNAWNFTTDGSSIYYSSESYIPMQTPSFTIKKIDPATGEVSTVASGTKFIGRLLWYNGGFYGVSTTGQFNSTTGVYSYSATLSPVTVTGSTFTVGSAVWTSPSSSQWPNLSAVASNGTDIYYAVSTWDQMTWRTSTDVRKLSNLSTDVSLVTISDYVASLAFRNGFLYTDGEKRDPATSYSVVARYANDYSDVMVGGYFYQIYGGKLVKYAGTPAGSAAKAALAKYFGF